MLLDYWIIVTVSIIVIGILSILLVRASDKITYRVKILENKVSVLDHLIRGKKS
jgi:hypothetical protein